MRDTTVIPRLIKLNDVGEVDQFNKKLRKAVYYAMRDIATPLKEEAYDYVTYRLRKGGTIGFEEDLKRAVRSETGKSGMWSRIWIEDKRIPDSPNTTLQEASVNEFGVEPHWEKIAGNEKLKRWAKRKGKNLTDKDSVFVGGSRGRVQKGKSKNWFWLATYYTMQKRLPMVFEKSFEKNLK